MDEDDLGPDTAIIRRGVAGQPTIRHAFLRSPIRAPETRLLFRGDLDRQRSRLLTMITAMVGSLDQPDVFESIVADLTKRHPGYGVRPEHYGPFEEALIWGLSECLGPAFGPEAEAAWRGLFHTLDPGAHANAGVESRSE